MKLIYLEWEDACSMDAKWTTKSGLDSWIEESGGGLTKQVGWIYKENKERLVLISRLGYGWDEVNEFGQIQMIPKTWIRKRVDLTEFITKKEPANDKK